MVKHKRLNEESWRELKKLTDLNYKADDIRRMTDRGIGTIVRVKSSKTFEEYQKISRKEVAYYLNQKKDKVSENVSEKNILNVDFPDASYLKSTITNSEKPKERVEKKHIMISKKKQKDLNIHYRLISDEDTLTPKFEKMIELLEKLVEQTKPQRKIFGFL